MTPNPNQAPELEVETVETTPLPRVKPKPEIRQYRPQEPKSLTTGDGLATLGRLIVVAVVIMVGWLAYERHQDREIAASVAKSISRLY